MEAIEIGAIGTLFASITYIFYTVINRPRNFKIDKIKVSAKYLEKVIQENVDKIIYKNKGSAKHVTNVKKMLKESQIRPLGIELNIYVYLLICFLAAGFTFFKVKGLLNNTLAGILLGAVAFITPYEFLKFEVEFKRRALRKQLPNFFLVIRQLIETTGDIIETLETAVYQHRIRSTLKSSFKRFLNDYRSGEEIEESIARLKSRFDNEIILRFIEDIRDNIEQGGDFKGTIDTYIEDAYDNERNYVERITENTGNITGVIIVLGMFLGVVGMLKKNRPDFIDILLYSPGGRLTVNFVLLLFMVCVLIIKYSLSFKDE